MSRISAYVLGTEATYSYTHDTFNYERRAIANMLGNFVMRSIRKLSPYTAETNYKEKGKAR